MSALFAFEVGEVTMRSLTFEAVIKALLERVSEPVDRQVCVDALELNCLWVDQINDSRKCVIISNLHSVLVEELKSAIDRANDVAVIEIKRVMNELTKRYPECID